MGVLSNIRNLFIGKDTTSVVHEDLNEKLILATQIIELVSQIRRINSFDSSIWNLTNVSKEQLQKKSLEDLKQMHSVLSNRISVLKQPNERANIEREELERAKWTGEKPNDMTAKEFDRSQRDDRYF